MDPSVTFANTVDVVIDDLLGLDVTAEWPWTKKETRTIVFEAPVGQASRHDCLVTSYPNHDVALPMVNLVSSFNRGLTF